MMDGNVPLGMDTLANVCISPNGNYTACTGESALAGPVSDPCSTLMASKVMVCRDYRSAVRNDLAASSPQGCPVSGRGRGDPPSRAVVAACLPVERANVMQAYHPSSGIMYAKIVATADSTSSRHALVNTREQL